MRVSSAKASVKPQLGAERDEAGTIGAARLGCRPVFGGQVLAQILAFGSQIRVELGPMLLNRNLDGGCPERALELPPADQAPGQTTSGTMSMRSGSDPGASMAGANSQETQISMLPSTGVPGHLQPSENMRRPRRPIARRGLS